MTGLTCAPDNESWVQTISGAAHDLPWESNFHRASVLGSGGANGTLSKLRFLYESVSIQFPSVNVGFTYLIGKSADK